MALASTYCLVIDLDLPKELYKLCHRPVCRSVCGPGESERGALLNCFHRLRLGFHGKLICLCRINLLKIIIIIASAKPAGQQDFSIVLCHK